MKKLSLLFAFVGFFALTNVSAQSAKCCTFPDGTCMLCPAGSATCSAKAVKTCQPAEAAACKKVAATCVPNPSCQKGENAAAATAVAIKSEEKEEGKPCGSLSVVSCKKAGEKATKTTQLAEKMN